MKKTAQHQTLTSPTNMNNIHAAAEHIKWSIDHSSRAYVLSRDILIDLRISIVNAELAYQEKLNNRGAENGK